MFTRTQRALLRITALIGAGFILGVAAQSPVVNPLFDRQAGASEDKPLPAAVSAVQQRVIGDRHEGGRAVDCSDLNSDSCRSLRKSYRRYLDGAPAPDDDAIEEPAPAWTQMADNDILVAPHYPDAGTQGLRVITVFNGSEKREFLVPRESR